MVRTETLSAKLKKDWRENGHLATECMTGALFPKVRDYVFMAKIAAKIMEEKTRFYGIGFYRAFKLAISLADSKYDVHLQTALNFVEYIKKGVDAYDPTKPQPAVAYLSPKQLDDLKYSLNRAWAEVVKKFPSQHDQMAHVERMKADPRMKCAVAHVYAHIASKTDYYSNACGIWNRAALFATGTWDEKRIMERVEGYYVGLMEKSPAEAQTELSLIKQTTAKKLPLSLLAVRLLEGPKRSEAASLQPVKGNGFVHG